MTSAGDGTPDRHAAVRFRGLKLERRADGAESGAGRDRWAWRRPAGTGGARGHACPAARRGRHRTKAERADRQRRVSCGRIAPASQSGSLSSHSDSSSQQRAQDYPRGHAHGALRAPLKT